MAKRKVVLSGRLEPEYIEALDQVAKAQGISRSKLLREFAENAAALYTFLKTERERQQSEKIMLNGNLTQWILEHSPPEIPPEFLHFLGEVMHHAAQLKEAQRKGAGP